MEGREEEALTVMIVKYPDVAAGGAAHTHSHVQPPANHFFF